MLYGTGLLCFIIRYSPPMRAEMMGAISLCIGMMRSVASVLVPCRLMMRLSRSMSEHFSVSSSLMRMLV